MPGWMIVLLLFWNAWMIRMAILSSFVAHLLLIFLADVRRRKATGKGTLVLWLAYQWSRWVPTFALGKLSSIGGSTTSSQWVQLVTIWAALLMFHAGGPDNITSYSLEDNILSWRQMIELLNQVLGAFNILYINFFVISGGPIVWVSSSVMFVMGIVKYGERAFVLWGAKLEKMRSRSSGQKDQAEKKTRKLSRSLQNLRRIARRKMDNTEEILLAAHDMLPITKGAFIDNLVYEHDVNKQEIIRPETWNENEVLYDVVDMELSLMYDILYTKAAMVHTWGGYAIRISSHFITSAMFLLFWSQSKVGLQQSDVLITYIVLGGTVILDINWLLRAVASTWTYSFLDDRPRSWLHHALLCSGKWRMIRRSIVSLDPSRFFSKDPTTSYRRWPGIIGQYNLFHECTCDMTWKSKALKSLAELVSLDDHWMEYRYHTSMGFHMLCYQSSDVRNLLFESIWECLKSAYPPIPDKLPPMSPALVLLDEQQIPAAAESVKPQAAIHRELEEALDFAPALQETILILHITTDIFLLISGEYTSSSRHVRAIKALSNYMVFLVAVRPGMLPGLKLRSLYEDALEALNKIKGNQQSSVNSTERKKNLAENLIKEEAQPISTVPMNISNWRPGYSTHKSRPEDASALFDQNIILSDGTSFALVLLSRVNGNRYSKNTSNATQKTPGSESSGFERYKRLETMIPELKNEDKGDFSVSEMLDYIFMAWVRLLLFASVRCTRDSHAKQLACGGELTTILWILNEHAGVFRIHRDYNKNKPEEFFSY